MSDYTGEVGRERAQTTVGTWRSSLDSTTREGRGVRKGIAEKVISELQVSVLDQKPWGGRSGRTKISSLCLKRREEGLY